MKVDEVCEYPDSGCERLLLALVVRGRSHPAAVGHHFLTDPRESLQVGTLCLPRGTVLPPHEHLSQPRPVCASQECLLVRRGRVRVDFYSAVDRHPVGSRWLEEGDLVVILRGGHGLEAVEAAELVEVKLGPYLGVEADKVRFEPPGEGPH